MRGENGSSLIGLVSFVTELKLCCTETGLGLSSMIGPPYFQSNYTKNVKNWRSTLAIFCPHRLAHQTTKVYHR